MHRPRKVDKPLPNCKGPKLNPFPNHKAAVDFRRLLSAGDSEEGGHAHVFEVCIESVVYALKVFKYYDSSEDEGDLFERDKKTITPELVRAHRDPFYNECRAYGRISAAGLNGKVAVHCFGFLILPAAEEDFFEQRFQITSWDRPEDEYEKPVAKRTPFRAIVKELVETDVAFTKKNLPSMLRHLRRLAELGVWPLDILARNYRAGLLLDFSAALTEPHYFLETRQPSQVDSEKREGFLAFDAMVEEAGIQFSKSRAMPSYEFTRKLRNPPQRPEALFLDRLARRSKAQEYT